MSVMMRRAVFEMKRRNLSTTCKYLQNYTSKGNHMINISEEVKSALHEKRSVVALESTIITHGMPFPENVTTAASVCDAVRDHGSIPATIGVLGGSLVVGLNENEIEQMSRDERRIKISKRELSLAKSFDLTGGTTVSATMWIAYQVGIPIFATGGIGGVHFGASDTFDISSDLTELSRTPVCVVSSGIKSILDIPRTLEYLETMGVTIGAFETVNKQELGLQEKQTNHILRESEFPAFFSPSSGIKTPFTFCLPEQVAHLINTHFKMKQMNGILIGNPIPEKDSWIGDQVEDAIKDAVKDANERNIKGKQVTPFILQRVNERTSGKSLLANISLIQNNASLASRIAVCLQNIRREEEREEGKKEEEKKLDGGISGQLGILFPGKESDQRVHLSASKINNKLQSNSSSSSSPSSSSSSSSSSSFSSPHLESNSQEDKQTKQERRNSDKSHFGDHETHLSTFAIHKEKKNEVVVVGGSIIDFVIRAEQKELMLNGSTITGNTSKSLGGVARNVADALCKLGHQVMLISATGDDKMSQDVFLSLPHTDLSGMLKVPKQETSNVHVILDGEGECQLVIGNMNVHKFITPAHVSKYVEAIKNSRLVVMDGNINIETMNFLLKTCHENQIPVWFEPTDPNVAAKIMTIDAKFKSALKYASPNFLELQQMASKLTPQNPIDLHASEQEVERKNKNEKEEVNDGNKSRDLSQDHVLLQSRQLGQLVMKEMFQTLIVTLAGHGALLLQKQNAVNSNEIVQTRHFNPWPLDGQHIESVSGAGDCFTAGMISGILRCWNLEKSLKLGLEAASISLTSNETVPQNLSRLQIKRQDKKREGEKAEEM